MKGEETWNSKVFDEYLDDDDLGKGNRPYKAAQAILYKLNNYNFKSDLKDSLKQLAIDFSEAFGGESGPLWYTFISCAAEKLEDELIKNTWKNWISAYQAGIQGLKETHKINTGDRTFVDTLEAGMPYITKLD